MFNPMKESLIPKDYDPSAELVADVLIKKFINDDKLIYNINPEGVKEGVELIDTKEGVEAIKVAILKIKPMRLPRIHDINYVIAELKKKGVIKPPQPKIKEPEIPIFVPTEYEKVKALSQVEIDEDTQKRIQANLTVEKAVGGGRVFMDKNDIEEIHKKALQLQKERTSETPQYYYEFAESGVVKGHDGKSAVEIVKYDLEQLERRKQGFVQDVVKEEDNIETTKQISDILERGLAYSATKFWYGKNVTINPASEFGDVIQGIDEILEIKNIKETKHLGLGIDITFGAFESEYFLSKVFKTLKSIKDGYKSKIKYHKDSNGKMMEEFDIPKIILGFDIKEVGEIAHMIRHIDDPVFMEEYKKHPLKFDVMNRIVSSCKKLGDFAEEFGNDISIKYFEVVDTIKELANQNSEMTDVLNTNYEDKFTKQLDKLIEEFKNTKK